MGSDVLVAPERKGSAAYLMVSLRRARVPRREVALPHRGAAPHGPLRKGEKRPRVPPVAKRTLAAQGAARDPLEKSLCPTRTRRRHRLNAISSRTGTVVSPAAWASHFCSEWDKLLERHPSVL